jgi:DNA adenine methylase
MTFLRWAGSKRKLVDDLAHYWYASSSSSRRTYYEGFTGSASLYFHLRPKAAVLVDINPELIQCLKQVRQEPDKLWCALQMFSAREDEYYNIREVEPKTLPDVLRAARFVYLNRFCFNGLYRTNRSGKFNVPYGGTRNGTLPSLHELKASSDALKSATLVCGDFYDVIAESVSSGDFVYLDPPYAERNKRIDQQYGPDVFGTRDLERVGRLLDQVDSRGGTFLLSYADCDEAQSLFSRWKVDRLSVKRTIAANSARRGPTKEVLVSNL